LADIVLPRTVPERPCESVVIREGRFAKAADLFRSVQPSGAFHIDLLVCAGALIRFRAEDAPLALRPKAAVVFEQVLHAGARGMSLKLFRLGVPSSRSSLAFCTVDFSTDIAYRRRAGTAARGR
jgi:hypothetical protein